MNEEREQRDIIWAPWRIDYILTEEEEGCFFCRAFEADKESRKEHLLISKGDRTGVLLNKFPYNNGHLLIAPEKHVPRIADLEDATRLELMNQVKKMTERIRNRMDAEGFNVGMNLGKVAGAGVPEHLHVHVVPRWEGDTNFMPVTGGTKVIPQSLEEVYDLLSEESEEEDETGQNLA